MTLFKDDMILPDLSDPNIKKILNNEIINFNTNTYETSKIILQNFTF